VQTVSTLSRRRVLIASIDDTTTVQLKFANGAIGNLTTLMATTLNWRLQLFGSTGWAALADQQSLTVQKIGEDAAHTTYDPTDMLRDELEHFALCISDGSAPAVTTLDILSGVAAMEAISHSAAHVGARTVVEQP
jgi:predicted dehydrogenase